MGGVIKVIGVLAVLVLTACAANPKKSSASPAANSSSAAAKSADQVESYDVMMKRAADYVKAGNAEMALAQYQRIVAGYPKNKEPYQRMSQLKFDHNEYGAAITLAQDVLKLDPTDQLANSVIAVSGLRLSATALGVLRRENSLSGSVKSEATGLADVLRENLGVSDIVPSTKKPKPKPKSTEVTKPVEASSSKSTAGNAKETGDPFGALK